MLEAEGYDLESLDIDAMNRACEEAVAAGEVRFSDFSFNGNVADVGRWLVCGGRNAFHIYGIRAEDSRGRSALEVAARATFLRAYRFLRRQPGLENLTIRYAATECGVRETVTIVGEVEVREADVLEGRLWSDAVCNAFYPIDIHDHSDRGVRIVHLADGVVPTVPRRALIPAGSCNALVAGRCLSSDRAANSSLRVQATAMATGQAVGALAGLAVETQQDVRHIPIDLLHKTLAEHGAILPGHCR
jgi:hypothetical protein